MTLWERFLAWVRSMIGGMKKEDEAYLTPAQTPPPTREEVTAMKAKGPLTPEEIDKLVAQRPPNPGETPQ